MMKVTNLLELEREKRELRRAVFVERLSSHARLGRSASADADLLEAVRLAEHDADLVVAEYFREPGCVSGPSEVVHQTVLRDNGEFEGIRCGQIHPGDRISHTREGVTCPACLETR